jgi:hypothetical protein
MKFSNDRQRKAMFANMGVNKFSLFDRFRSDDYFVDKRNELVYKIKDRGGDYSERDISKMVGKLNKLNAKIRGREKREIYEEGHGPIRRIVDSAVDVVHEPKSVYSMVGGDLDGSVFDDYNEYSKASKSVELSPPAYNYASDLIEEGIKRREASGDIPKELEEKFKKTDLGSGAWEQGEYNRKYNIANPPKDAKEMADILNRG